MVMNMHRIDFNAPRARYFGLYDSWYWSIKNNALKRFKIAWHETNARGLIIKKVLIGGLIIRRFKCADRMF
jgi:hypothetical protein